MDAGRTGERAAGLEKVAHVCPADVLTKPTAREEMRQRSALVGGELHAAQSDRSLQARSEEGCR